MFPPIEPFASGHLAVSHGNTIYWETSGSPHGQPALYLHGGPGGGMKTGYRRRFDPERFMIVGLDQRGCGRSRPLVTDDLTSLQTNTTQTLIADIEAMRTHLGVDRWLVTGASWGTTLALAYAQAHPAPVSGLALMAVTSTTKQEVEWITESVGRLFPEAWGAFARASDAQPGDRLIDAYYRRITSDSPSEREAAACAWCAWEDAHVSLNPHWQPHTDFEDPVYRQVFATLVIHYWKHAAFLPDAAILEGMGRLREIRGHFIHGGLDISGPAETARRLHRAWPGSTLTIVEDEGHGGPKMVDELARAIATWA